LPSHLTCDVHVFVSGDRTHDGPLAMLAWEKVAQATQEEGRPMPNHVIMWSDGSPNQFKYTYPVWFLSRFKKRFGFKKVWWNFYASCHGKGMQDAAGAWVKTRVAKAILLGGEIKSVRDFFDYCLAFLTTQSDFQVDVLSAKCTPFTSSRRFYLLDSLELAMFRAEAENVTTWSGLRECHFFWAGMDENEVGRKWVGCACPRCLDEDFLACDKAKFFEVEGTDYNAPLTKTLVAKAPKEKTRADDIASSLKVPTHTHTHTLILTLMLVLKGQGCWPQHHHRHPTGKGRGCCRPRLRVGLG
jgi:hypothetical protein